MESTGNRDELSAERRSAPRHVGTWPVQVDELWVHADCSGVTHDVSRTGGLLLTGARLPLGDPVKVRLFLSGDFTRPTVVYGRVLRSFEHAPSQSVWRFAAAVAFDQPIPLDELGAT